MWFTLFVAFCNLIRHDTSGADNIGLEPPCQFPPPPSPTFVNSWAWGALVNIGFLLLAHKQSETQIIFVLL